MKAEVYRRLDGRWDWRIKASNGQIIATSGGQGYERPGRAELALVVLLTKAEDVVIVGRINK